MKYTVAEISNIIDANVLQKAESSLIEYLLFDSRKILFPSASVFFALSGPKRNGVEFIEEVYRRGVRAFIVDDSFSINRLNEYPGASFLHVNNVLDALHQLTTFYRNQFSYPVIGITGSNGKTIVKEWLYQLLSENYQIVRSPKSYNSQIGVPISVWQMSETDSLAIFEAGISLQGEMQRLQKIIRPNIGIVSFIGDAHAEGFESIRQKIDEKLLLFKESELLIYSQDDELLNDAVQRFCNTENINLKIFSWGKSGQSDLQIIKVEKNITDTTIYIIFDSIEFNYTIPFTDEASINNSISCCAVMLYLKLAPAVIKKRMNELRPVEMRLELKQGINQCSIINDSYSADISSLSIALDFLSQQQQHPNKTVIISDFFQSGMSEDMLCRQLAKILEQKNISRLIGIGPVLFKNKDYFKSFDAFFFLSTDEFIQEISSMNFFNESILLKGARVFRFEKISSLLEQKLHETVMEINLSAVRANLKIFKRALKNNVKMMAMVKAFSYGSGSYEIANLLQHEGIEYLAVAYTDEGVELRKSGIRLPIMVMNIEANSFDNLVRYQLEPELYSFSIFDLFRQYLLQKNINQYPVHLKLDTGMHRLGFLSSDIDRLCQILSSDHPFKIQSAFSHLVASEESNQDSFTAHQTQLFIEMTGKLENSLGYTFIKHLSNTAAIRRHPQCQLDMVRLGIGLYGIDNSDELNNVTTLKTTISQIKKIKTGDTVGYGRKGQVNRDSTIATVRIGYADGYSRIFGNGNGKMLVNGKLAPVIGNVCMDMTMLDISDIKANEGDEVIVFGEQLSVKDIATWANTIPYEILTGISQRVKRVYYEE